MLKKILGAVAVIVLVLLVVIAMQPSSYRVARTATIAAPPADVFALVNDYHKWDAWSPWAKIDPSMKTTFEGPAAGTGSIYYWTGNSDVGEGRMTTLESRPNELVRIKLEFIKPIASTSDTTFQLAPAAEGTNVEWSMAGDMNFMTKAFCLFMGGMDKMVGPDFDKGLRQMKSVAEANARK